MANSEMKQCYAWSRLHFWVFPVEVTMLLFVFAMYFNIQIYQQYYYQRIAYMAVADNLSNNSNVTLSNTSLCLNQELIDNFTGNNETSVLVQTKVNGLNIITNIGLYLPSGFVALILGPLSDKFGRKPFLIVALCGQAFSNFISLVIVYFKLNTMILAASSLCIGIFGGYGGVITLSFSCITDVTPERWLTARSGLLVATIFIAVAFSSTISFRLISYTNCNFLPPAVLLIGVTIVGIVYTVFIPDPLSKKEKIGLLVSKKGLVSLNKGLKLFCWPAYIGLRKFWKLWTLLLVMAITVITEAGTIEIMTFFLQNKPLLWSYDTISTYETIVAITTGASLVLLLPLLVVLKLPDAMIGLLGTVFATGSFVFMALLRGTWQMFLAGVLNSVGVVTGAVCRSMVPKLVSKEVFGATFSFLGFTQMVAISISTLVFNSIYRPGTAETSEASIKSPEASFWIMAFLWAATFPMQLTLLLSTCKGRTKPQVVTMENERLLKDDENVT